VEKTQSEKPIALRACLAQQAAFTRKPTPQARYEEAKAGLMMSKPLLHSARLDLADTQVRRPDRRGTSQQRSPDQKRGNFVSGAVGGWGGVGEAAATLGPPLARSIPYVYCDIDEKRFLRFHSLVHGKKLEANSDGRIPSTWQLEGWNPIPAPRLY